LFGVATADFLDPFGGMFAASCVGLRVLGKRRIGVACYVSDTCSRAPSAVLDTVHTFTGTLASSSQSR
jgi:hypothetical protein